MIKPRWRTLRRCFIFVTAGYLVFIPTLGNFIPAINSLPSSGQQAWAATPTPTESTGVGTASPSPTASPTSIATPAPTGSPSPTATPTPTASPVPTPSPTTGIFNPQLYSIDAADSPWVVVNKQRPLSPLSYVPGNLVSPKFTDGAGSNPNHLQLAKPAAKAIKVMATAMKAAGAGTLFLSSTYRSYQTQVAVHAKDVAALGLVAGENLAARPGYSEHQTGLAADLSAVGQGCTIRVCFAGTKAGQWLAANAWQYGFILRYPLGQTAITGYQFEPWHYRYVGPELAAQMHNTGVTVLEQFWKLPSAPKY